MYIVGLYVDDLILYLCDAQVSLQATMHIIETFGLYSVLKMYWQKSALMPLHPQALPQGVAPGSLKTVSSFKYLVIIITVSPSESLKVHLVPLLQVIKTKTHYWQSQSN